MTGLILKLEQILRLHLEGSITQDLNLRAQWDAAGAAIVTCTFIKKITAISELSISTEEKVFTESLKTVRLPRRKMLLSLLLMAQKMQTKELK